MTGALAMVATLVAPLAGALWAVAAGRQGVRAAWLAAAGVAAGLAALGVGVARNGPQTLALGGWDAPLGIGLRADGLAVGFLTMSALVMTAVVAHAAPQFDPRARVPRAAFGFWPLALLLWAALNAVFLSRDLFNLYVGLELLTLAAIALVALDGRAETLAAALRYMAVALIGSLLFLLGAALLYSAHGTLDIGLLAGRDGGGATDRVAAALITAGLVAKTALFPFHAWLPPAHSGAPAPASAMLSALVPKASFYVLLRLWFEALPELASGPLVWSLAALGAVSVFYGGLLALRQARLKLIVAYSTIAQIGYLFLVFPLAGGATAAQPWAAAAWTGTVFQALSHGLAKAAMFLCAGLWMQALGSDRLDALRGAGRATPMITFAFGLAAMTLMGLPPSGGFIAKYLLMTSAFASGQVIWAAVLVLGGLLSAAYLYRPMAAIFARDPPAFLARAPSDELPPVSRWQQAVPLALAVLAVTLGIISNGPFAFLQIGRPEAAAAGL